MKTRFIGFLLLLLAAILAIAPSYVVTIPQNDLPRVTKAYGYLYQLGHDATISDMQYATSLWIVSQTKSAERQNYNNNYVEQPMEMQPSPSPTPTASPSATATFTPTPTPTPTP